MLEGQCIEENGDLHEWYREFQGGNTKVLAEFCRDVDLELKSW